MPTILAAAQVRARVVQLLTNATAAGANVADNKPWPTSAESLPALRVSPGEERMESEEIGWPTLLQHELELQIEGQVRDVDDITGALDALAREILQALLGTEAAAHLEPLPSCELQPLGISRLPAAEGSAATGRVLVRMRALYQTVSNNPSTLV